MESNKIKVELKTEFEGPFHQIGISGRWRSQYGADKDRNRKVSGGLDAKRLSMVQGYEAFWVWQLFNFFQKFFSWLQVVLKKWMKDMIMKMKIQF